MQTSKCSLLNVYTTDNILHGW